MAAALEDPYNQQFQLVCEATIPVRAPLVTHDQLLAQNMSRIGYPGKVRAPPQASNDCHRSARCLDQYSIMRSPAVVLGPQPTSLVPVCDTGLPQDAEGSLHVLPPKLRVLYLHWLPCETFVACVLCMHANSLTATTQRVCTSRAGVRVVVRQAPSSDPRHARSTFCLFHFISLLPPQMWGEVEGSSDRWPLAMHEEWPELRHHTKHHSQWVTLIREHIHIILNDTFLNDLFSRHCYVPAQRWA